MPSHFLYFLILGLYFTAVAS